MTTGDVLTIQAGGLATFAAPAASPFALLMTITDLLIPQSTIKTYDIELATAGYLDSVIRLRAEAFGTSKDTGGVGGAHMTAAVFVVADAVFNNKNGVITFTSPAAGGANNPMQAVNNEMTLVPQACDGALQSGGGAPPGLTWGISGTKARLTLTTQNSGNRSSYEIDIYQRKKAAP